jgi:hypothetical protein
MDGWSLMMDVCRVYPEYLIVIQQGDAHHIESEQKRKKHSRLQSAVAFTLSRSLRWE